MRKFAFLLSALLAVLSLRAADPPPKDNEPLAWLAIPGETWGFAFNIKGYDPPEHQNGENPKTGKPYAGVGTHLAGITVTGFIEALPERINATAVRDGQWPGSRRSQYGSAEPRQIGDIPCMNAVMTKAPAELLAQLKEAGVEPPKHFRHDSLHCYWVKDDWWLEIHISKISADEEDFKEFSRLIRSARLTPGADRDRLLALLTAHGEFASGKYSAAVTAYEGLWKREGKQPSLGREMRRVMLDELGMAYGISGDLKKARSHYQTQIAADPDYAMYYYNLACTEAERENLKDTISNLREAFKRKSSLSPLEKLSDPREDNSFKRFLAEPEFQQLMKEIGLQP